MKRAALVLLLLLPVVSQANVYIYPKFSTPVIQGERLLFTSPDGKRLICTDLEGRVLWQKRFRHAVFLGEEGVFDGSTLHAVDASSGKLRKVPAPPSPWQRAPLESVALETDALVFVTTAKRAPYEDGSYTFSDAALEGRDRATGQTRWRRLLLDGRLPFVRAAAIGSHLIIADGIPHGELFCANAANGELEARLESDDAYLDVVPFGDAVALIEKGRFVVREVPSLRELRSFPLPARENLRLRILRGDTVLTTGIYSAAAFDLLSGEKLWEKTRQMEISAPIHDALYVTDWLRDEQLTRLVRVDLRSGEERVLLTEHAEEPQLDRATKRAIANRERDRKKKDEARRIPVGKTLCFEVKAPFAATLRLDENGTFEEQGEYNTDRGTWTKSGDTYALRSTTKFRSVISGRMQVELYVPQQAELLPEFRDRVEAWLAAHPEAMAVDAATLRSLDAAMPCPPGAESSCTVSGELQTGVFGDVEYENLGRQVGRDELEQLVRAIDAWTANADRQLFRFRLAIYRGFTYIDWIDTHAFSPSYPREMVESNLDAAADLAIPDGPTPLLLVRCAK